MARSSSFRSKLFIDWHKSIVSSDWSDTMVWFGQILLYLSFTILYIWSLLIPEQTLRELYYYNLPFALRIEFIWYQSPNKFTKQAKENYNITMFCTGSFCDFQKMDLYKLLFRLGWSWCFCGFFWDCWRGRWSWKWILIFLFSCQQFIFFTSMVIMVGYTFLICFSEKLSITDPLTETKFSQWSYYRIAKLKFAESP